MSVRVHTTTAVSLAVATLTDDRLVELYGDEFAGLGESLVIEDAGNCEALVITGSPAEIADLARAIADSVGVPEFGMCAWCEEAESPHYLAHLSHDPECPLKPSDTAEAGPADAPS